MANNSIGTYEFITLSGNPDPLKKQVELHTRPGVDGVTIGRVGRRGVKFTLQSKVDSATQTSARALFAAYCNLIGADPVGLTWWQLSMLNEGFRVAVLDVRQVECRRVLLSSGGLVPAGLGLLTADWDLVAVAY